ncbi:MAG: hypothetical protein R6W83_07500 [Cryobacterium sp.]
MSSYVTTSAAGRTDPATGYVTAPVVHRSAPTAGYVSNVRHDRGDRGYTRSEQTRALRHLV